MSEPLNVGQELIKRLRNFTKNMDENIISTDEWQNVAMKIGEKLSSTGPDDYYNFTPQQWFEWANSQIEKSNILTDKERKAISEILDTDAVQREAERDDYISEQESALRNLLRKIKS